MFATLINILHIPVNYGTQVGHLWYVYMLLGIYLFAPVISPWLQTAPKQQIRFYLIIWAVTMTIPYIHLLFPEIWGECFWNKTPMLYYFSGFLGFAILGFYIKRVHAQKSKSDNLLGFILILIGYLITAYLFAYSLMISWITGQEYLFPMISVVTFFSSYLVIKVISYLPGSKYITG